METLSKAIFGIALALLGMVIPQVETPTPDKNDRIVAVDTVPAVSDNKYDSRLSALEARVSSLESKYGSYTAPVKSTTTNYGSSGSTVSSSTYTPVYTAPVVSSQTCVRNPDGTVTCESSYSGPQYKTGPLGILKRRVQ